MTIPYIFIGHKDSLYYSTFALYFLIGIADYFYLIQHLPYKTMKKTIDSIRENRSRVLMMKNYLEIGILLEQCILLPFNFNRIFLIVFHGNYLRIKYYFNKNLHDVIAEMDGYFRENFEQPGQSNVLFRGIIKFTRTLVLRMRVYKEENQQSK